MQPHINVNRWLTILVAMLFCSFVGYAQIYKMYQTKNYHNQLRLNTATGEVKQIQDDGQSWIICPGIDSSLDQSGRFNLNETKNMWNFILLDSYTGRLWQVQYSSKDLDALMCIPINEDELAQASRPIFSISPLTSMYQYYLINEQNGDMWKFQWSTNGDDYRWIERQ